MFVMLPGGAVQEPVEGQGADDARRRDAVRLSIIYIYIYIHTYIYIYMYIYMYMYS